MAPVPDTLDFEGVLRGIDPLRIHEKLIDLSDGIDLSDFPDIVHSCNH